MFALVAGAEVFPFEVVDDADDLCGGTFFELESGAVTVVVFLFSLKSDAKGRLLEVGRLGEMRSTLEVV